MSDEEKQRKKEYYTEYNKRPEVKERKNGAARIHKKEMTILRIELGRCTICDKDLGSTKFKTCGECRLKSKKYQKERRKQNE